jgi:hypothetical protein
MFKKINSATNFEAFAFVRWDALNIIRFIMLFKNHQSHCSTGIGCVKYLPLPKPENVFYI